MKIELNKEKTCAFTGHRILEKDFNKKVLIDTVNALIDSGFDTFLCGMAVGFDALCFRVLEQIRKEKNIRIIACVPCNSQSSKFSIKQKEEYNRMIKSADEMIVLSIEYTPYCMFKRNMYMVDNCSVLVSYLRQNRGGTYNTVEYAKRQNVKIVSI